MENNEQPKVRRRIVLTEDQIRPIVEMLSQDKDFLAFKRSVVINDFLLAIENGIREYVARQKQDMMAMAPMPQPTFQDVNPDLVAQYEQQVGQRLQRHDARYGGPMPAYPQQPVQQQSTQQQYPQAPLPPPPQPPLPPQQSVRPTAPVEQPLAKPAEEDDDISFDNFDDSDF